MDFPPAFIPWSSHFDEIWLDMPPPMPPPIPPGQEAMMAVNLDDILSFIREDVHNQVAHAVQMQKERSKRYPETPKRNGRMAMKLVQQGKHGKKDGLGTLKGAERQVDSVNGDRLDGIGGYKRDSNQVNGVCPICPLCHTRHAINPELLRAMQFQLPYGGPPVEKMGISVDRLGYPTPVDAIDYVPVQYICHHFAAQPSPSPSSRVMVDISPKSKPASRSHPKKKKSKPETPIYEHRRMRARKDDERACREDRTSTPRIQDIDPPITSMPSHTRIPSSSSSSVSGRSSVRSQGKERSYSRTHSTVPIPPSAARGGTGHALDEDNRSTVSVESDSTKLGIIPPGKLAVPYDISRASSIRQRAVVECKTQQPVSKPRKKRGFFT